MGGYVPFNLQLQKKLDTMFHPKMISGGGKGERRQFRKVSVRISFPLWRRPLQKPFSVQRSSHLRHLDGLQDVVKYLRCNP